MFNKGFDLILIEADFFLLPKKHPLNIRASYSRSKGRFATVFICMGSSLVSGHPSPAFRSFTHPCRLLCPEVMQPGLGPLSVLGRQGLN
jgi:hypothetical protein